MNHMEHMYDDRSVRITTTFDYEYRMKDVACNLLITVSGEMVDDTILTDDYRSSEVSYIDLLLVEEIINQNDGLDLKFSSLDDDSRNDILNIAEAFLMELTEDRSEITKTFLGGDLIETKA
jgi:hypothetical protein